MGNGKERAQDVEGSNALSSDGENRHNNLLSQLQDFAVEGETRAQSQRLLDLEFFGTGQLYVRPAWFNQPFDHRLEDTQESRYLSVLEVQQNYLNPLDYETLTRFGDRMKRIFREQETQRNTAYSLNVVVEDVYRNWTLDTANIDFLPEVEQRKVDARAIESRCKKFWPKEIRDIIASNRPLIDSNGHFIVPDEWLLYNDTYELWEARYEFARRSAPLDPSILPFETGERFLVRQKDAGSTKLMTKLKQEYNEMLAKQNIHLVARTRGSKGRARWNEYMRELNAFANTEPDNRT
jgi:hypothetical protein